MVSPVKDLLRKGQPPNKRHALKRITSRLKTKMAGPKVSFIRRFHCIFFLRSQGLTCFFNPPSLTSVFHHLLFLSECGDWHGDLSTAVAPGVGPGGGGGGGSNSSPEQRRLDASQPATRSPQSTHL